MLVLSRKKNEAVVINNEITIVIVEIRGDKVRLGIEAPTDVSVHRREVWDAIQRNNAAFDADKKGIEETINTPIKRELHDATEKQPESTSSDE